MKTVILILSILLLIAGTIIFLQWRQNKDEEDFRLAANVAHNDAINRLKGSLAHRDSVNQQDRRSDGAKIEKLESAANRLKQANTGLSKEIAILRPQIQPQLDTLPAIKRYVELSDSSLKQKDAIIDTLTSQTVAQQAAYDREKAAHDSTRIDSKALQDTLTLQSDNNFALYQKAEKKAKRKFSVGPNISYSVTKDGLSPSFGMGIQWSLFKF